MRRQRPVSTQTRFPGRALDAVLLWTLDSRLRARQVGVVLVAVGLLLPTLGFLSGSASAVHDSGAFELDGDATDSAKPGADWDALGPAVDSVFVDDDADPSDGTYFFRGGSKDVNDIPQWAYSATDVAPDKNTIAHAFAASYFHNEQAIVTFGADRYAVEGDAQVGFWFLQDEVALTGDGGFTGKHRDGDLLVLSHFTNGGMVSNVKAYRWQGGQLVLAQTGVDCDAAGAADTFCATVNGTTVPAPWNYVAKTGEVNEFPPGAFIEGGINLSAALSGAACFATFLAETRSSAEPNAQLKDFAIGSLETCATPDIDTTSQPGGPVGAGTAVRDVATLTGPLGTVTGAVQFFLCGPTPSAAGCTTGGDQIGAPQPLVGGSATSPEVTRTATGHYCWRAAYVPDGASRYRAATHTNATTECFEVVPPQLEITKTAGAATVDAGDPISFTIGVTSTGLSTAMGVTLSDPLPVRPGVVWSESSSECSIVDGTLSCSFGDMPKDDTRSVIVTSETTKESCGVYDNTATARATNHGDVTAAASTKVLCAAIELVKTPDRAAVSAGEEIGFTLTARNNGTGTAKGVVLTDVLPSQPGLAWSIDPARAGCAITAGTLTCGFGDLGPGQDASVHIVSDTDSATCPRVDNTGRVTTTNDGSDEATASVSVNCGTVGLLKTPDAPTVDAGADVGFTLTVSNTGAGDLTGVVVNDPLPSNTGAWRIDGGSAAGRCTIAGSDLTCVLPTLAAGAIETVHVSAATSPASCPRVDNTASVTTGNDGSASAAASVVVRCGRPTIDKTAVPAGPVDAGTDIGFRLTVANAGPGQVGDVKVADPLPPGFAWRLVTNPGDACAISATGTLGCSFGTLDAGATRVIEVAAATTAAQCSTVRNTATVTSATGTDSDDASVVVRCPDLRIAKTAEAPTVSAGSAIAFTVTVTNNGPGTATGVTVRDPLAQITKPGTAWRIEPPVAGCAIAGAELSCTVGDLAAGQSLQVRMESPTTAASCAVYDNTATADATNDDPVSASADTTVLCPTTSLTKVADAASVPAGGAIGFTMTVTSDGPGTATAVVLRDPLPVKTGISWRIDPATPGCGVAGNVLECSFGDLAAGQTRSVHVVSATTGGSCGTYDNTATLTWTNEGTRDARATTVVECAAIAVVKNADAGSVPAGSPIGFSMIVTNNGAGTASGVTLTDPLPSGDGIEWRIEPAVAGCSITAGTLHCGFGDLASGATRTVRVTSPTTSDSCRTYDNTATVTAGNGGSASDDASTTVVCGTVPPIAVDIDKTGPSLAHRGDTITYRMVVTNTGGVDLVSTVVTDPMCDAGTLVRLTGDAVLNVGEVWTYECTRVVRADDPDPLPNTATVVGTDTTQRRATDSDPHLVDIISPSILIVKTANPTSVAPPADVTYTYVVTNTGDVVLTGVDVTDDILGFIGTIGTLEPGESATLTRTVRVTADSPIRNVATTRGVDPLELVVTDDDDAVIAIVLADEPLVRTDPPPPGAPLMLPRTGGPFGSLVLSGLASLLTGLALLAPTGRRRMRRR